MQRKNKILFSVLIAIALITTIIPSNKILSKEIISTEFILGEEMGFDLTPGKLNFGQITQGNTASREITIDNNFEEPIEVSIKSKREISKYIIVSENNFQLNSSESKNVTFTAYSEDITEFRKYKGEIIIISKKV